MRIEAEINKIYDEEKMKGIATVKIDDCFVVRGIRILDGDKGLHLGGGLRGVLRRAEGAGREPDEMKGAHEWV